MSEKCVFPYMINDNANGNMYAVMVDYVHSNYGFKSMNGRDILWFPLEVPLNVSMNAFLCDIFKKYITLLHRCERAISEEDKITISCVIKDLLEILKTHKSGDVIKAYELFENMMRKYYIRNDKGDVLPTKSLEKGHTFYRMRANEHNLKEKKEFYHLPSSYRHLCASYRFSISGYPCLYLGYSKNVCYVEMSHNGTMCGLELLEQEKRSLKILDLTFADDQLIGGGDKEVLKFIKAWPLIASCYIVMANSQINRDSKFREEYIIPQMLTTFLRYNTDFDGICYYTTRNENLNPRGRDEEDFRNIVLFPKNIDSSGYDMDLINRFHWFEPFNVGKIRNDK